MTLRCSSEPKVVLSQLVKLYAGRISRGSLASKEGESPFDCAVRLARTAFAKPPTVFDDSIPIHCLHLDILQRSFFAAATQGSAQVNPLLASATSSLDTALRWFLEDSATADPAAAPALQFYKACQHLARDNDCSLKDAIKSVLAMGRPRDVPLKIFSHDTTSSQLYCRALWMFLLAVDSFGIEEIDSLSEAFFAVSEDAALRTATVKLMSQAPPEVLQPLVESLQNYFTTKLLMNTPHSALINLATVLQMLYDANTLTVTRGVIPFKCFYNATAVEFSTDDIVHDYERMRSNQRQGKKYFCFSRFPCLVDTKFKSLLMQIEVIVESREAMHAGVVEALFSGGEATHHLNLKVDRQRLIETTLREVQRKRQHLKKPLRVTFVGEEGIDAGGLRKELFQLLLKDLLSPDYGMFYETQQHTLWFQPEIKHAAAPHNYFLIGTLIGLAVQNSVILDVQFPRALYRRLLGRSPDFEDLKEVDEDLAHGLQELLAFEETPENTVEDVFCRTFVQDYDVFGEHVQVPLCEGGAEKPLTGANRQEYVDAMVAHVLQGAAVRAFEEFHRGFLSVAERDLLRSLHPEELELLVCGSPILDFEQLEATTRYDGYKKSSKPVLLFWEVLHEMSTEEKREFLKFTTGSDRVPVGGLKDLNFIIGKNGDDSEMLPTAHTCFNHLLLPAYTTKDKLREKLLLAVRNCTGFGLQ